MRLSKVAESAAGKNSGTRIRQLDLIRAVSIWVVVIAHAFMGVVVWGKDISLNNLLAVFPNLQILSWFLQVMPLFFIAGAAANALSFRSGSARNQPYSVWLYRRSSRLLAPVIWYLMAIILLSFGLTAIFDGVVVQYFLNLSTQLLWFLGVYLLMTALTPLWVTLAKNFTTAAGLIFVAVVVVDIFRFQNPAFGLANFVFGWGLISLTGVWLLEQLSQVSITNRNLLISISILLAIEISLVILQIYPLSLVGLPGAEFSNMAPPSALLVLHGILQALLWIRFKTWLETLTNKPKVWQFSISTNLAAMSIYLWHLPILMGLHSLLNALGIKLHTPTTDSFSAWYFVELLFLILLTITLVQAWIQYAYLLENLIPKIPTSKRIWLGNGALSFFSAIAAAISLLMFSVVGPYNFPNQVVTFSGLNWTNGQSILAFGVGLLGIWGSTKFANKN
ncbi:MAG: hypothetical protein RL038_882 [Actinomycetota bacterium]